MVVAGAAEIEGRHGVLGHHRQQQRGFWRRVQTGPAEGRNSATVSLNIYMPVCGQGRGLSCAIDHNAMSVDGAGYNLVSKASGIHKTLIPGTGTGQPQHQHQGKLPDFYRNVRNRNAGCFFDAVYPGHVYVIGRSKY